jgi:hypothetical protein
MPLKDGQKFGRIQVKRVGKHTDIEKDPKARPSAKEKGLLPASKEVRIDRDRHDFVHARVPEPAKGKDSDDSTPERVHWLYGGKLVSTKETFRRPQTDFDVDLEQGRGLFMTAEDLIEVDLKSGATTKIPYKGWTLRKPPTGARYLHDDQVLLYSASMLLGKRSARGVELHHALVHQTLGLTALNQRVIFSSAEDTLILGYNRGVFRILASLGVWGGAAWLASEDTIRFYVDPFQNEGAPADSCGTFELSGALEAWEHCFTEKHEKDYPLVEQKAVK